MQNLENIAADMCDSYCRYPEEYKRLYGSTIEAHGRMLEEACKDCPLANYVERDKYRWHYLADDPNDLPQKFLEVLVCLKGGSVNRTWLEEDGLFRRLGRNSQLRYKRVIAWREIDYPDVCNR